MFAGRSGEADPHPCWGRPMTRRKKQVCALRETRRGKGPGIRGRIRRDNVGKIPLTAGAGSDLPRLLERSESPKEGRVRGIGA